MKEREGDDEMREGNERNSTPEISER